MRFQSLCKLALLSFFAIFLTACGSGGGSGTPAVTIHTGTLTVGGKPVEGANFSSTGGLQNTSGTTAANGQFTCDNAATPQVTLPTDFAELNPVQDAILTVNGKPVSNVRYIAVADPNATATRNIIATDAFSDSSGNFEFDPLSIVTFKIGNTIIGTLAGSAIPADSTVTLESLIAANSAATSNPTLAALPNLLMASQGTPTVPDSFILPSTLAELDPVAKTILTLGGKPISGVDYTSGGNTGLTTQSGVFAQDATTS